MENMIGMKSEKKVSGGPDLCKLLKGHNIMFKLSV